MALSTPCNVYNSEQYDFPKFTGLVTYHRISRTVIKNGELSTLAVGVQSNFLE